jgi:quercetin dioxygenase-like cupin family protein
MPVFKSILKKLYNTFFSNYTIIFLSTIAILSCKKEVHLPDPLKAGWKGKTICKVLEENDKLRVLKCTFKPGDGHEKHYHKPHAGYALQGSTFQIEDATGIRQIDLVTGSHFTSEGVDWHIVKNIGDSTAVYLIFEPK